MILTIEWEKYISSVIHSRIFLKSYIDPFQLLRLNVPIIVIAHQSLKWYFSLDTYIAYTMIHMHDVRVCACEPLNVFMYMFLDEWIYKLNGNNEMDQMVPLEVKFHVHMANWLVASGPFASLSSVICVCRYTHPSLLSFYFMYFIFRRFSKYHNF